MNNDEAKYIEDIVSDLMKKGESKKVKGFLKDYYTAYNFYTKNIANPSKVRDKLHQKSIKECRFSYVRSQTRIYKK